jgi:hypothetical protein
VLQTIFSIFKHYNIMKYIHSLFRSIEAKSTWRLLFAILTFTFFYFISENTIAQTNPRYLGLTITNDNTIDRLGDIQTSKDWGMNAVQITIRWVDVENDPNGPNAWQRFDAQINKAKLLGMKIFIRIDMSNSCLTEGGGVSDNDACYNFCSSERMSGYITSTDRRQHWLGGRAAQSSLSAQSTINRMINFSNTILDRYAADITNQNILWISCTTSAQQELGFDWRTAKGLNSEVAFMPDYSPSMIESFRTWLNTKYGGNFQSMKSNWGNWALQENGLDATTFSNVYPPKPNRPVASIDANFDNFKTTFTDHFNAGRDWYTFRNLVIKNYASNFETTVRNKKPNLKIINEHGSVFDINTILTGVFGFKSIGGNVDGIKVNTGPFQDHRFSMDIERSNFPTKIIMDEVEYIVNSNITEAELKGQFREAYERGSTFETAKFDNLNSIAENVIRYVAQNYVTGKNVGVDIPSVGNTSYTLQTLIEGNSCNTTNRNDYSSDCQAYKSYRAALGNENRAVNIIFDESYLNSNANITTTTVCIPTCNFTLANNTQSGGTGTSLTLNPNCTGADCGGVGYSWTCSNGTSGSGLNVTLPTTAGIYTYTVTGTKGSCSKISTITVNVIGGCVLTVTLPNGGYNCGSKILEAISVSGGSGNYVYNIDGCENSIAKNILGYTGDAAKYVDYPFWWQQLTLGTHIINVRDKSNPLCSGSVVLNVTCANTSTPNTICSGCDFNLLLTNSQTGPVTSSLTLNPNCTGTDCGGVSYSWSGNGQSGSGLNIILPNTAGTYQYTITASKSNCTNKTSTISVTVTAPGTCNPVTSITSGGTYKFKVVSTGQFIRPNSANKLEVSSTDNTNTYRLDTDGSGYKMTNISTGKIVEIQNGSTGAGGVTVLAASNPTTLSDYQRFQFELVGSNFKIKPASVSAWNWGLQMETYAGSGEYGLIRQYGYDNPLGNHQIFSVCQISGGSRIASNEVIKNESEEKEGIFIAPNPVNNILHYSYISDSETDEIQLQIFDMTGRTIKSLKQQKTGRVTKGEISVESFMQGSYILNATDGIKKDAKRFIKE